MSLRRQCYEWRNISDGIKPSFLNGYPVNSVGDVNTTGFLANQPVDIFIGDIGNNIDIPGQLKAYQYIVLDSVAVFPPTLHAQIYVGTTKYFQDPDNVPSRDGGLDGFAIPFPNGATWTNSAGSNINLINTVFADGLKPALIIQPGQVWGVEVTSSVDVPTISNTATEQQIQKCFVKYLLIDGGDSIVAKRLLDAGWTLTVENVWKYKQDILKTHLYAGLAPLPTEVVKAKRKV